MFMLHILFEFIFTYTIKCILKSRILTLKQEKQNSVLISVDRVKIRVKIYDQPNGTTHC